MGFYFGIFSFLAVFSLIEIWGLNSKQKNICFFVFSSFMFVISFIRWEVGTDWEAYYRFFNYSTEWFSDGEFEWGFARLNEIAKIVFDSYTILLFMLGGILFSFQTVAIHRLTLYPITSLLFLWSISFGNTMFIRQSIATAILFFSVLFIKKRKFLKFLLCVGLAMLFHRTSIIFLPAWWIFNMNIRTIWLWLSIGVSMLMTAGIKTALEGVSSMFGPIVQAKLDIYLSDGETTFGATASLTQIIIKGVVNKVVIFAALMSLYKRVCVDNAFFKGLVNIYWFGILLYFSTIGISIAMVRLSFAYDAFQIVLLPILFYYIDNKKEKLLYFCMFILYLLARLYIALFSNYYDLYVPFKTFIEQ